MRADGDTVEGGEADGPPEHGGIASVKASRDVGRRDDGHQPYVVANREYSEGFTEVGVQVDGHGRHPRGRAGASRHADASGRIVQNKRAPRYCGALLLHRPGSPSIHGALP
jgi:hypothetical protein